MEGLARAGVGKIRLVDFDEIRETNINRQILALRSTLGRAKADVAAERVRDINPAIRAEARREFAGADTMPALLENVDLVIDAVDSVTPKVDVVEAGARAGIPVYSSLGAATRRDADAVRFGYLFESKGCPLGSQIRKRLRRRGITEGDLWCVYSDEDRNKEAIREPEPDDGAGETDEYIRGRRRSILGSMPTVTALFGLRLAHEATLRLAGIL